MKRHFDILDGLRGTAAIIVVIFHLLSASYVDPHTHPLHHAYLAVDFFFLLSGFVVGYAYDDHWGKMSFKEFMKIRLIRLHPLVVLSVIMGAICYIADSYTPGVYPIQWLKFILVFFASLLLLPTPSLPGRWPDTHSFNGPGWSLFQEYLANIGYGLIAPRLHRNLLIGVVVFSAIVLVWKANSVGHLQGGWGWNNIGMAPIRVAFPFSAGLLLFRTGFTIKIPFAYPALSLTLLMIMMLPWFPHNGIYEAGCIIFLFPLIVAAGAGSAISKKWNTVCHFSGQISYPIYILHYPFVNLYTKWVQYKHPSTNWVVSIGIFLGIFFIVLAWLSLKYYDEPIRKKLNAVFRKRIAVS